MPQKATSYLNSSLRRIDRVANALENTPTNFSLWILSFGAIILVRLLIEQGLYSRFSTLPSSLSGYELSHLFLAFFFEYILLLALFVRFAKITPAAASNIILFTFLATPLLPVIDFWFSGGKGFWGFYEFGGLRELAIAAGTFFGQSPEFGVTPAMRIGFAIAVPFTGLYVALKTKSIRRGLFATAAAFVLLFALVTLPSYIAFAVLVFSKSLMSITSLDVAGIFLTPYSLFARPTFNVLSALNIKMSLMYILLIAGIAPILARMLFPNITDSFIKNVRVPQVIYHAGLALLGSTLAFVFLQNRPDISFFDAAAVAVLVVGSVAAWIASVCINDLFDQKIDAITNPKRPLITHAIPTDLYRSLGITFFFISIFIGAILDIQIFFLFLIYQALAWIYSAPPFRLKRFPVIATLLSASASILILISGFVLVGGGSGINDIPLSLLAFLFVAYTLTIPLKDFKDVDGDRADSVFTIPVLLGVERARTLIGSALFFCYTASPIILHETTLIIPSILFGSLAFWSVIRAGRTPSRWTSFRSLPGWNILFITLYGFLAAFLSLSLGA